MAQWAQQSLGGLGLNRSHPTSDPASCQCTWKAANESQRTRALTTHTADPQQVTLLDAARAGLSQLST